MIEEIKKQEIKHPMKCLKCRRKGFIVIWDNIKEKYEELICMKCREESK
jgi:hypothetical protein